MNRVYLDHAATAPLLSEAREAMLPWLDAGNASTLYAEGRKAKQAIDEARETVSNALGCDFGEAIFTSGGTEGAAMAILGLALANLGRKRNRVLISAAEHHCVLNTKDTLEALGFQVDTIPVDREARPILESVPDDTLLVAAMHANNEIGSVTSAKDLCQKAHQAGALYFCDAVQTFLKLNVAEIGADLLSVSAHKIGGPKGVGALLVRAGVKLKPILAGGGQERELRAGTENVAAIAGFAAAVNARPVLDQKLRHKLENGLIELGAIPTVTQGPILDSHVHVRFPGRSAETLLIVLDRLGISAGSGAACSSGSIEPSHVLLACGYSNQQAKEGLRFTLGPATTPDQIDLALNELNRCVR